jgi:hypothetical protein
MSIDHFELAVMESEEEVENDIYKEEAVDKEFLIEDIRSLYRAIRVFRKGQGVRRRATSVEQQKRNK